MLFYVGAIIVVPFALWLLGVLVDHSPSGVRRIRGLIGRLIARLRRPTMAERMRQRRRYSYLETMCTGSGEPLVLRQAERVAGRRWRWWE